MLDIIRELTPLTQEIALPLYVAISTDTGGFIYSSHRRDPPGRGGADGDRH